MTRLTMTVSTAADGGRAAIRAIAEREAEPPVALGSSEDGLVSLAQTGDKDAFATLYRSRLRTVSRYVTAIVRDPHRAEDVIAQTFLLAWRDLPKLRRIERFDAWLLRIAYNQSMTELRRRQSVPLENVADPPDPDRHASPAAQLDVRQDGELVQRALHQLPVEQREVLVLRFLRELPHSEVARQLGKTEQACRALQYRALRRMLRIIEGFAAPRSR